MNALFQRVEGEILCAGCGGGRSELGPLEPFSLRSHRPASCPGCGYWIPVRLSPKGCRIVLAEARDVLTVAAETPDLAASGLQNAKTSEWSPGPGDPIPRVPGATCRLQALAALCTFYSGCYRGSTADLLLAIRRLSQFRALRSRASRWRGSQTARRGWREALDQARYCLLEEERLARWARSRLRSNHPTEAHGFVNLIGLVVQTCPL